MINLRKGIKNDNVIFEAIVQQDEDRIVFVTYRDMEIVGLNFHMGNDEILWEFKNPDASLTEIYKRLLDKSHIQSKIERINKAIELYQNAFLFQDENSYVIPKSQLKHIQKALDYYIKQSAVFNKNPDVNEYHELFDMNQLSAMMNYDISVQIDNESKNTFASKHGVDFPSYK